MREKLAQTLSERRSPGYWDHAPDDPEWRNGCRYDVDAILDAMMEPSEEMLDTAYKRDGVQPGNICYREMIKLDWQAMLKAAKER